MYHAGLLALSREDMAAVIEVAKRGLALDPTNPGFHALAGVGTGHQAQNDVPEGPERQRRHRAAEQRLAEAVRMDPTNAEFRRLRKNNARDSRDEFMVKLMTVWMFGLALAIFFLPIVLNVRSFPCWSFLVLPVAVGFLVGVCKRPLPRVQPRPAAGVVRRGDYSAPARRASDGAAGVVRLPGGDGVGSVSPDADAG